MTTMVPPLSLFRVIHAVILGLTLRSAVPADGVITKAELMNHIGEGSDASMRLGSMSRLDVVSTFDDMDLNGDGVRTPCTHDGDTYAHGEGCFCRCD